MARAFIFFCCYCNLRDLHSFPTRRSSDLVSSGTLQLRALLWRPQGQGPFSRSEEHTSELQSQSNLVCRLPPEKKKLLIIRNYSSRKVNSNNTYYKMIKDSLFKYRT